MNLRKHLETLAVIGLTLGLAACGSDIWNFEANPMTTVDPITDMGVAIQSVYYQITVWTLGIAVLVGAIYAYVLVRYRDQGQKEQPKQIHGNPALEIGWTLAPVVIVVLILVPTVRTIFELGDAAPEEKVEVKVIGKRWWWEFRYVPNGDTVKDEIVTANQLHLPANKTASFLVTSDSVIHSFWVPRLGGKRDAVPGRTNRLWFTLLPDCATVESPVPGDNCSEEQPKDGEPLHYMGECAEFCGESHAQMKFDVVLHTESDFREWADTMIEPEEPSEQMAQAGHELFGELGCGGCHAITGHPRAKGIIGPNLTNFGQRSRLGAGVAENTPENLKTWIADPDALKQGATGRYNLSRGPAGANDGMNPPIIPGVAEDPDGDSYPNYSDDQLDKLVAYLQSLK